MLPVRKDCLRNIAIQMAELTEFEAMLIAIRSKAEPTGLLSDVIQRSDGEIQEDMEYMGPMRRCDVEDAQKKIRNVAEEKLG